MQIKNLFNIHSVNILEADINFTHNILVTTLLELIMGKHFYR